MALKDKLSGMKVAQPKKVQPVWAGPSDSGENGGITQSLLSVFLCCRERFRLRVCEGLTQVERFNHRMEYGNMWHVCEEYLAKSPSGSWLPTSLQDYCKKLCEKYKTEQTQIQHWYNVCRTQFPIYVDYWRKHQDVKDRTPLLQEQVFHVPYELPSGRIVYLRGKWDSVDIVGKGKDARVYLQENKTKGDLDEQQLRRQLLFDLQTMLYHVALVTQFPPNTKSLPVGAWSKGIAGVRYNVIRRPLSGGKDSIRQKQDEEAGAFYQRLGGLIADHPEYYFMRWKVEITEQDVTRFKTQFLDPILEQLCDWWSWISSLAGQKNPFAEHHVHWRTPYGIWNALLEGGSTELDEYLASGSELGLRRGSPLFGELRS